MWASPLTLGIWVVIGEEMAKIEKEQGEQTANEQDKARVTAGELIKEEMLSIKAELGHSQPEVQDRIAETEVRQKTML